MLDDKKPAVHDDVAPYIKAVQAIQNRTTMACKLKDAVRRIDMGPIPGPEVLDSRALYTLKFTISPKRSELLIDGLKEMNLINQEGVLQVRLINFDKPIQFLQEITRGTANPLTDREAQGVRTYLEAAEQNLQLLGRDIERLPLVQRSRWLFYAGMMPTPRLAHYWTHILYRHGILGAYFRPINGGAAFDAFVYHDDFKILYRNTSWFPKFVEQVREALFPLPAYDEPPAYTPSTAPMKAPPRRKLRRLKSGNSA